MSYFILFKILEPKIKFSCSKCSEFSPYFIHIAVVKHNNSILILRLLLGIVKLWKQYNWLLCVYHRTSLFYLVWFLQSVSWVISDQRLCLIFSNIASVFSTLSLEKRKQAWNNHDGWFCVWMCVSVSSSVHLLSWESIKHGCKTINGYPLPQFPTLLSIKILNVWTWAEVGSPCNVGSWHRILSLSSWTSKSVPDTLLNW
jgi:hypothetical protein